MSKIKSLLEKNKNGRIYVYLADEKIGKKFLQDAEDEGFTFCDGVKPTKREISDIFALNDDMTINYVGTNGRIAYQSAKKIGDKRLIKIDYRDVLNTKD